VSRALIVFVSIASLSMYACTGTDTPANVGEPTPTEEPSDVLSPSPSPSPVPAPKPKNPGQASWLGTYKVNYNTVHSTVSGSDLHQVWKWTTTPNCRNGPCTTLVESSGKWQARAAYVKGHYRWARTIRNAYSCTIGSTTTNINATGEYVVRPSAMRLVDGAWVVSRFSGSAEFRGHKSGGCVPLPEERTIIKGKLRS
jgi:hypothetical protein